MSLENYYSKPHHERVAIIAINIVHPAGNNLAQYWQNVCLGKIAIGTANISLGDWSSLQYKGEIKDLDLSPFMGGKQSKKADNNANFAIAAGIPPLLDTGILTLKVAPDKKTEAEYDLHIVEADRAGIYMGIAGGGVKAIESAAADIIRRGSPSPRTIPYLNPAKIATELGKLANFTGRQSSLNLACSSGVAAFEDALDKILRGRIDLAVAGGAESIGYKVAYDGFSLLGALAKCDPQNLYDENGNWINPSRPLRQDRCGLVIGEGAAIGILARLDFALGNRLPILAELASTHTFTDPKDELEPQSNNVAKLITKTLDEAFLDPTDVDCLVTHTAGTIGDEKEIDGAKIVFGSYAKNISIRPSKINGGHLMGVAGAVGVVDAVQSIVTRSLPPIPYGNLIDSRGFDFPSEIRRGKINVVVVSSLGLDGQYSGATIVTPDPSLKK